jgi:hypothetical protein
MDSGREGVEGKGAGSQRAKVMLAILLHRLAHRKGWEEMDVQTFRAGKDIILF